MVGVVFICCTFVAKIKCHCVYIQRNVHLTYKGLLRDYIWAYFDIDSNCIAKLK